METTTQFAPYLANVSLERSRWYLGSLLTFLATGKDNGGQFSLTETLMRKGLEPPKHMHTREDETVYVLEGEIKFMVGENECTLKAREFIYLPKNIPHQFFILSETAKYLLQTFPAGLEEVFMEASIPAERMELPAAPSGPPDMEFIKKLGALLSNQGVAMYR